MFELQYFAPVLSCSLASPGVPTQMPHSIHYTTRLAGPVNGRSESEVNSDSSDHRYDSELEDTLKLNSVSVTGEISRHVEPCIEHQAHEVSMLLARQVVDQGRVELGVDALAEEEKYGPVEAVPDSEESDVSTTKESKNSRSSDTTGGAGANGSDARSSRGRSGLR